VGKSLQFRFIPELGFRVKHEDELQALARRLRDLSTDAPPRSSRLTDYILLAAVVLCLFIFDTNTWLQRLLLVSLTLAVAFLLWFTGNRISGSHKQSG
jgi:hypothetical protein